MSKLPETVAITGTIGSGKSTVRKELEKSIPVLDCDRITFRLLEPQQKGWVLLRERFPGFFDENHLNKSRMAQRMFSDPAIRSEVEGILHPLILAEMRDWMNHRRGKGLCAVEVPLLFELGLQDEFDQTWLVTCDEETAMERLVSRGMEREDALSRMKSQMPASEKEKLTDIVIDNSTDLENLRRQIHNLLKTIQK